MFYSELTGDLQETLPKAPNKFTSQTAKNYYAKTACHVSNDCSSNVSDEVIKKILLSLDTSKAVGIDQILAKISDGWCKSTGCSFEQYIKFINKTINLPRSV